MKNKPRVKVVESVITRVEGTSPFIGWDPILGTRVLTIVEPPIPPSLAEKDRSGHRFPNARVAMHYNVKKQSNFSRSVTYA